MTDHSNGAGPAPVGGAVVSPPPAEAVPAPITRADRAGGEPGELLIAMSPRQIIGGFALLAGLIVLLRRRSRRGR
ncbi:MAG: hypothetical protein HYX57_08405 [Chloroflexi bacterium]|nr:hypothetical protein [Chloroflexota bacterium]